MRIATFDENRVGVLTADGTALTDVTGVVETISGATGTSAMRALITHWDKIRPELTDAVLATLPTHALADVTLGPPVPDPGKIAAAPVNYVDHMHEMSQTAHVSALGIFLKATSSVIGPGDVVRLPYDDRRFDHEGELAFVIGRTARHVAAQDAFEHIFGFTGLMDMTMRGGEDRSTRKSFDTFTPMGPWIVTTDELGPPSELDLRLSLNETERQHAPLADLIWDVPTLLAYVSSVMTLHPGDVVATGTPAGVGPIADGDTVELVISRIGALTVTVSADGATHCPTTGAGRGPVPPPPPA